MKKILTHRTYPLSARNGAGRLRQQRPAAPDPTAAPTEAPAEATAEPAAEGRQTDRRL